MLRMIYKMKKMLTIHPRKIVPLNLLLEIWEQRIKQDLQMKIR